MRRKDTCVTPSLAAEQHLEVSVGTGEHLRCWNKDTVDP